MKEITPSRTPSWPERRDQESQARADLIEQYRTATSKTIENPLPQETKTPLPRWRRRLLAVAGTSLLVPALLTACSSGEKEGGVTVTPLTPTTPATHETTEGGMPSSQTPIIETPISQTPTEISPSPTPFGKPPPPTQTTEVEKGPISETLADSTSKPILEFPEGTNQQIIEYVTATIEKLPPLGNTRIQFTNFDREGFWPNKDGVPTLEVGMAGYYWQRNFFHGLAHGFDPSLNSEITRVRTPEQNEKIRQAIETALTDPFWGENLRLDSLYSSAKNIAATHPENRGNPINQEILNAQIRLRADGAYIGRNSEFAGGPKTDFIFGSEFLSPIIIDQFVQSISQYHGANSMSEFITNRNQLLDQLATSSPLWRLAVADIRSYSLAFDNYDWAETQISLPRPLMLDDQRNARALLTFADLVLRDRFMHNDPELLNLLSVEQRTNIQAILDQRIRSYRNELLAEGLGLVLQYENPQVLEIETQGINIAQRTDLEMMRRLIRETPYYQVYQALFPPGH